MHKKGVWEIDPLSCPKCSGEMRIISFIYQYQIITPDTESVVSVVIRGQPFEGIELPVI